MAMTIKKAETAFHRVLLVPQRLVEVHVLVPWGAGAPARQQALYGAVAVTTVAAWQGFVEDLSEATRVTTERKAKRARIDRSALAPLELNRFNTPNRQNTVALLGRAGLNLPTGWSVTSQGQQLNDHQAWEVINAWLLVRHAVAHGFPFSENADLTALLAHPNVGSRVLTGGAPGRGTGRVLRLQDAQGCLELFTEVAAVIQAAAMSYSAAA
jgi:hypothetical protein